jgi:hypothetical protein
MKYNCKTFLEMPEKIKKKISLLATKPIVKSFINRLNYYTT